MSVTVHTAAELGAYAFWDTDPYKLNLEKDKRFIISRIFERAKMDDILNTIVFYGIPTCTDILI
ncbi:DUF6922 domain-containing protein, partial [Salmonella enterica]|uniref:DUF6922 domain-containing protein n=1 Tax=Salmonella enterica TaxID=28901 RepID=UPI003D2D9896